MLDSIAMPTSNNSIQIDIVDFAPFLDGSESAKQRAADQILNSFKSTGFVYLANFGLSNEEVQEMFDWVRCDNSFPLCLDFFTHPTSVKALLFPSSRDENARPSSRIRNTSSRLENPPPFSHIHVVSQDTPTPFKKK